MSNYDDSDDENEKCTYTYKTAETLNSSRHIRVALTISFSDIKNNLS